ncbi:unnamed protein product [Bursaphelenchus okinawaensis]|uniref:LysM domain-containing protein n=1 Tax=Bursaphelenchus okinawaensis TaxID=465554 RepID=A0A811LDI7_9BILA|nr:unnamed protein product [Bursaphelenchus okinawaensis]CAG9122251.1 unnamed protein product [Bursaphelenchus okinawaensis]
MVGPVGASALYSSNGPKPVWLMEIAVIGAVFASWFVFYKRMVPLKVPDPEQKCSCLTEHIVQPEETCSSIKNKYNIRDEDFSRINEEIDCESLEAGATICVKEKLLLTTTPIPTTTREADKKNLLETLISGVFGEERQVGEAPTPLLYHPFPDYGSD